MEAEQIKTLVALKRKSDALSKVFREEGNIYFNQLRIYDALFAYNKSLAYAESKLNLALAYGNRSAAFFEAKYYAECIESIKLAKENDYPAEKKVRLTLREQKSLDLIKKRKEEEDPVENLVNHLTLSYPPNNNLPWMIKSLEVRQTLAYGRGVYTKRSLKAGDIICVEDTKIQLVNNGSYKHCNNCSKANMLNLIPCLKTASLMFCSTDCRDDFYKYVDLSTDSFNPMAFILKKIEATFGDLHSVSEYLDQKSSTNIFDFDLSDPQDPNYLLNYYKCFLTSGDYPIVRNEPVDNQLNATTRKLLNSIGQKIICNSIAVPYIPHEFSIYFEKYATGIKDIDFSIDNKVCFSTFRALLNHSCVSNIGYFCYENRAVFFVKKPVRANEQLFVNYTKEFSNFDKDRAEDLAKLGVDNCGCIACIRNFSWEDARSEHPNLFLDVMVTGVFLEGVCGCGKDKHMERIAKLFALLQNFPNPMSMEHIQAYKTVQGIYYILADRLMYPA